MEKLIDLHTHSTASDGTDSPEALIEKAKAANLSAIALTDHDNFNGLEQAQAKADELGIELVKGVELSTDYNGGELHILGYWFDDSNTDENLNKMLQRLLDYRNERNEELLKNLAKVNVHLTMDDVYEFVDSDLLCRPHFALAMLKKGYVKNLKEAFTLYLGDKGKAYTPKKKLEQKQAIEMLREAHALVSFAHPFLTMCSDEKERRKLIKNLKDYGLHAIEALYSVNTKNETAQSLMYAKEFNLACTGGSDYHGNVKPDIALGVGRGNLKIPYILLDELKQLER